MGLRETISSLVIIICDTRLHVGTPFFQPPSQDASEPHSSVQQQQPSLHIFGPDRRRLLPFSAGGAKRSIAKDGSFARQFVTTAPPFSPLVRQKISPLGETPRCPS